MTKRAVIRKVDYKRAMQAAKEMGMGVSFEIGGLTVRVYEPSTVTGVAKKPEIDL